MSDIGVTATRMFVDADPGLAGIKLSSCWSGTLRRQGGWVQGETTLVGSALELL